MNRYDFGDFDQNQLFKQIQLQTILMNEFGIIGNNHEIPKDRIHINKLKELWKELIDMSKNNKDITFLKNTITGQLLASLHRYQAFGRNDIIIGQPHDLRHDDINYIVEKREFPLSYTDRSEDVYEKIIHKPDSNYNLLLFSQEIAAIKSLCESSPKSFNQNILYIGCGDSFKGELIVDSLPSGHIKQYIGTDYSKKMIESSKKRLKTKENIKQTFFGDDNFKNFDMSDIKQTIQKAKETCEGPITICFMGSTILNKTDEEIKKFLEQCQEALDEEDNIIFSFFHKIDQEYPQKAKYNVEKIALDNEKIIYDTEGYKTTDKNKIIDNLKQKGFEISADDIDIKLSIGLDGEVVKKVKIVGNTSIDVHNLEQLILDNKISKRYRDKVKLLHDTYSKGLNATYEAGYSGKYDQEFNKENTKRLGINSDYRNHGVEFDEQKSQVNIFIEPDYQKTKHSPSLLFNLEDSKIATVLLSERLNVHFSRKENLEYFENVINKTGLNINTICNNDVSTILSVSGKKGNKEIINNTQLQEEFKNPNIEEKIIQMKNIHNTSLNNFIGSQITKEEATNYVRNKIRADYNQMDKTQAELWRLLGMTDIFLKNSALLDRYFYRYHKIKDREDICIIHRENDDPSNVDKIYYVYKDKNGKNHGGEIGEFTTFDGSLDIKDISFVNNIIKVSTNKGIAEKEIDFDEQAPNFIDQLI